MFLQLLNYIATHILNIQHTCLTTNCISSKMYLIQKHRMCAKDNYSIIANSRHLSFKSVHPQALSSVEWFECPASDSRRSVSDINVTITRPERATRLLSEYELMVGTADYGFGAECTGAFAHKAHK